MQEQTFARGSFFNERLFLHYTKKKQIEKEIENKIVYLEKKLLSEGKVKGNSDTLKNICT